MRTKTALAVAGSVLALPSTATAAAAQDSQVTGQQALRASGRLTVDARAVRLMHDRAERRARSASTASTVSAPLQAIAACESGGNPSTDTGNGFYGKYQFSKETWHRLGGRGSPAAASEAEQDRRAANLYARAGSSPWPSCGR